MITIKTIMYLKAIMRTDYREVLINYAWYSSTLQIDSDLWNIFKQLSLKIFTIFPFLSFANMSY